MPGVENLVKHLYIHKIPMAVCTGSFRAYYEKMIGRFGDFFPKYFTHSECERLTIPRWKEENQPPMLTLWRHNNFKSIIKSIEHQSTCQMCWYLKIQSLDWREPLHLVVKWCMSIARKMIMIVKLFQKLIHWKICYQNHSGLPPFSDWLMIHTDELSSINSIQLWFIYK